VGFYRRERRDGGLGSSRMRRRDQGQNRGCCRLAGTDGARCGSSSARSRGKSPRGGLLRGIARFCGSAKDFRCAGRPTWPGGLSCTMEHQPAGLPVMGQGRGGERRE
jgi:hypothetical protein